MFGGPAGEGVKRWDEVCDKVEGKKYLPLLLIGTEKIFGGIAQ